MPPRLLAILLCIASGAEAATYSVDTSSDAALSACTAAPADCSLRGAILQANLDAAEDRIEFALPSSDAGFQASTGHWLIQTASALPLIEQSVVIDGYTQPGALPNTQSPAQGGSNALLKIELRPQTANSHEGIATNGGFVNARLIVRGLAINRYTQQIVLAGLAAHRVEGCFLGTDLTGQQAAQSGIGNGVRLQGGGPVVIGGLDPASRNLIAGMANGVVNFAFAGSDGIRIQGNLIGTNAAGTAAIGHRFEGLSLSLNRNSLIGGSDPAARNVIAASGLSAISMNANSGGTPAFQGSRIQGNYIGTDVSGRIALGNGFNPGSPTQPQAALLFFSGDPCAAEVGGTAPGEANLIAHSGSAGILVGNCRGVRISGNRFQANRGIPIDLSSSSNADGITANDPGDADSGGNRLQNTPVLSLPGNFLPSGGLSLNLGVLVDSSTSNASYPLTLQFWRANCDGGGSELIGSSGYSAAQAQSSINVALSAPDGANVLPLTALVIDNEGNTSEFAPRIGDQIALAGFEDGSTTASAGLCR